MKRIAIGAYGTVYRCVVENEKLEVAVKLMELPKSMYDRCVLHDIFTEILIMDTFRRDQRICRLYDYGVSEVRPNDHFKSLLLTLSICTGSLLAHHALLPLLAP